MPIVQEMVSWLVNPGPVPRGMRATAQFSIATNQQNHQAPPFPTQDNLQAQFNCINVSGWALGNLTLDAARTGLTGVGQFWFSDRRPAGSALGPFGPETDVIRVSLDPTGRVQIVAVRWGNAVDTFTTTEANRVLTGFGGSIGNQGLPAHYAITLARHFIPL